MKTFSIVRNGSIKVDAIGAHFCGYDTVSEYPYAVELRVKGELQGPDYFVVENQEIDDVIQSHFAGIDSMSCEKMCDDIIDVLLAHVRTHYEYWQVMSIRAELTGTMGKALLSVEWRNEDVN